MTLLTHLYTSRAHTFHTVAAAVTTVADSSSWCYYCDCFLRCQKMQQAFKKQQKHSVITMYKTENKVLFLWWRPNSYRDLSDRLWLLFQLNLQKWQEKFFFPIKCTKKCCHESNFALTQFLLSLHGKHILDSSSIILTWN